MTSPARHHGPSRRIPVAIFVAITLVLLAVGYWYYRKEAGLLRREKYEAIAAIGELKSGQIQQWRKDRLADAGGLARSPVLSRIAADFLRNPGSPVFRADLLEQLQLDRLPDQYHNVLLFGLDGNVLFGTEKTSAPVNPATQQIVTAALTTQEPLLSGLFRETDGIVHMDAAAAIRNPEGLPIAVVVLRTPAYAGLFPLILSWPTPSPSAETLLVQRDGEEVLYLNPLRHRSQTALTLRAPITRLDLPAAQAVLGKHGEFNGKDYRGVEVLADLRPIPNSPWFMVAKMDAAEMMAQARYRAGLIGLVVGSLILLAAAATAYIYRHQQAGLFRELYESERKEHEAQKTFRATLLGIGEGVITTDRRGFVLEMNPVAEMLTGWPETDAHGKPLEQVFHVIKEDTRATLDNPVDQVLWLEQMVAMADHTLLIARDGVERSITYSAAPIRDDSGTITDVVLVFSDRTTERAAQNELRQNERRLRTIIEAEPECVKLVDPSGRLMEMNPAGLAMLEAGSLQEVQGCGLIDFIRPESQAAFKALHARVMSGESGTLEFEITGLKGTRRLLETHAVPLRNASGQVSMLLGITRDITERKAAEAGMLQRSRQLAVLSKASQQINTVLESPLVMRQLVTTAMELTGATDGSAGHLLNGKMVFKEYNLHGKPMPINFEFEVGYGVPGWVMQTRAPYMTNSAENDPHVIPDIQKALGFHNLADVPIINHQGDLLGCFEIHNKPGGFNDTDLLMLQGLAASAAIALENAELLAERKLAEEALRAASQKLALHFQQTPLAVIEWDMKFRVARWNLAAEKIFGYTTREAIGQHATFIVPESDHASVAPVIEQLLQGEGGEGSMNENVRKDGLIIQCEWYNTSLIDADGHVVGVASQVQDVTERKASEARIQRLTQLYLAQSQFNQAIARSTDQGNLFAELCRSAVLFGGMKMAWIGLADPTTRRVVPVASFGDHVDYLKDIQISLDADGPLGFGPTGSAIRGNQPFWCQDFQNDPSTAPWRERGLRSGWNASAALPLHRNGLVVGVLNLYSAQSHAFDEEARGLLSEMAADISHALDTFEAEAKRRQAEADLRETQAIAGLGSYTTNFSDGTWTSSGILDEIFGIDTRSDRTVEGWVSLVHPADKAMMVDYLTNEVLGKGNPFDKEYRIIRKRDGMERWVHGLGRLEFDAQSRPVRMVGTIQDITERKRAEEALRESQELFSLYLSHSPIFTFIKAVTPTESRVLYASDNFLEMIGIPGPDMVGKTMVELFPAEFGAKITADDWAVVAGGGVLKQDEDLNGRSYTTIKFPVVQGGKTLLAGYTIDITERKQAEDRLRLSEQTFSGILNSVAEAVYIQDEKGIFLDVNRAAENLYGYSKEEFLGQTPEFLSAPGKNDLLKIEGYIEKSMKGMPQSFEFWGRRKNGTIFPKEVSISLGDYFGKKVIIAVARDISERKLAEEALRKQTEELRARNDTLTRFNRVAVDRELRMVELKREVNDLCRKLGEPPRHRLAEDERALPPADKGQE